MARISYAFFQRSRPIPLRCALGALRHDVFYYLISDHKRRPVELLGDASSGCAWAVDASLTFIAGSMGGGYRLIHKDGSNHTLFSKHQ